MLEFHGKYVTRPNVAGWAQNRPDDARAETFEARAPARPAAAMMCVRRGLHRASRNRASCTMRGCGGLAASIGPGAEVSRKPQQWRA